MVREWGLSARLGLIGYGTDEPGYLGVGPMGQSRPHAEATQRAVDEEVSRLLLEKETISGQELTDAFRASRAPSPDTAPRPA
jgi:ATP-dependent Zn protease